MQRPRIIPCLLLSQGQLVKTRQFKHPAYLGDPINAVRIFNEKGADELCLQDIDASKTGQDIDFDLLSSIASEAFMPLSYGGGIHTLEQAKRLFRIGFEKIVINTALAENPELLSAIAKYVGSQSVVASIDAVQTILGRWHVAVRSGTKRIAISPQKLALQAQALGAGEILLNCIQRDGMQKGYDIAMIREVSSVLSIPLIACGGAGTVDDLAKVLHDGKAHAAAAGSLFVYYGALQAVLIHTPEESELQKAGVYRNG